MKKILFFFLLSYSVLSIIGCASNDVQEEAAYYEERRVNFTIQRITFNYEMEKVSAWRSMSNAYRKGDITPPKGEMAVVVGFSYEYEDQEASCREEARKIYLNLCELSTRPDDFVWLYENKVRALRECDADINKFFFREIIDKVFHNEDFKPDSVWVGYMKAVLGREYYTSCL